MDLTTASSSTQAIQNEDAIDSVNEGGGWRRESHHEAVYRILTETGGVDGASLIRVRSQPQSSQAIFATVEAVHEGLSEIGSAAAGSGATARDRIARAVEFHNAPIVAGRFISVRNRLLGQRNALIRVMQVLEHSNVLNEATTIVRSGIDVILALSANVAALTGSRWQSVKSFLEKFPGNAPDDIGWARLKLDFDAHHAKASQILAQRLASGEFNFVTGPTPSEIAETMGITLETLRVARANRCGLTCINPEDRKTQNTKKCERRRRRQGMKPQTERNKTERLRELAERAGCSLATVKRHRKAGTLESYLSERGVREPKVTPDKEIIGKVSDLAHLPSDIRIDRQDIDPAHENWSSNDATVPVPGDFWTDADDEAGAWEPCSDSFPPPDGGGSYDGW